MKSLYEAALLVCDNWTGQAPEESRKEGIMSACELLMVQARYEEQCRAACMLNSIHSSVEHRLVTVSRQVIFTPSQPRLLGKSTVYTTMAPHSEPTW